MDRVQRTKSLLMTFRVISTEEKTTWLEVGKITQIIVGITLSDMCEKTTEYNDSYRALYPKVYRTLIISFIETKLPLAIAKAGSRIQKLNFEEIEEFFYQKEKIILETIKDEFGISELDPLFEDLRNELHQRTMVCPN